jgi:hypothetical protein
MLQRVGSRLYHGRHTSRRFGESRSSFSADTLRCYDARRSLHLLLFTFCRRELTLLESPQAPLQR